MVSPILDKILMVLVAGPISLSLVDNIPSLQLFLPIATVTFRFKMRALLLIPNNIGKSLKIIIKYTKIYEIKSLSLSSTSLIHLPTNITKYPWESMPMKLIYFTTIVFHNYYNAQNS